MNLPRALICLFCCLPGLAMAVQQYGYKVIDQKPQNTDSYVQGLQIVDEHLYVSTGLYGKSRLLRYRFHDNTLEASRALDKRIFAEGMTVLDDRVYQLTWHNRMLLVYEKEGLQPLEWFPIPGEGWGLTHDGSQLIYSDGTDTLRFISPQSKKIVRSLAVRENGKPLHKLNELEWIDGAIWANVWMTDRIVIIDPQTGNVEASINLAGLLPPGKAMGRDDVLNGIARNPADGSIWVTGKRWPWLFQIELVPETAD